MAIKEITKKTLKNLKKNRVSVLLVYMPGCQACEMTKEPYKQFSEVYNNISFFQADMNKVVEFYSQYADKQEAYVPEVDENNEPKKDEKGNVITKLLLDDAGNPVMVPKMVAPMFYVFVKEEQSSENEYGYVGGIDGADIQTLNGVLEALNVER